MIRFRETFDRLDRLVPLEQFQLLVSQSLVYCPLLNGHRQVVLIHSTVTKVDVFGGDIHAGFLHQDLDLLDLLIERVPLKRVLPKSSATKDQVALVRAGDANLTSELAECTGCHRSSNNGQVWGPRPCGEFWMAVVTDHHCIARQTVLKVSRLAKYCQVGVPGRRSTTHSSLSLYACFKYSSETVSRGGNLKRPARLTPPPTTPLFETKGSTFIKFPPGHTRRTNQCAIDASNSCHGKREATDCAGHSFYPNGFRKNPQFD